MSKIKQICDYCERHWTQLSIGCENASEHKQPDVFERIAYLIEQDISDRRGIKSEWNQIDEEIQDEIKDVWASIIREKVGTLKSKLVYEVIDAGVDGTAKFTVGFFETEEIAKEIESAYTAYGQGYIYKRQVFSDKQSFEDYKRESLIEKAKSKLSKEERKLLGIK